MKTNLYFTFLRYLILLAFAFRDLFIFYWIFTPLTIFPIYFLLSLFFKVSLVSSTIFINHISIDIISACIGASAYYLLLILNLTTSMNTKKRIYSLLFSFLFLLACNILRIFFFSLLFIYNPILFNLSHLLFWYIFSAVLVFLTWFLTIKLFKIKEIPIYSDLKGIIRKI